MSGKTFQLFPILPADEIIRQPDDIGHIASVCVEE
jgi:hypothetical protein